MNHTRKKRAAILCAAIMVPMLLAACARHVSRDISPEGVAGEVIFPAADDAVLKEGTFPSVDSLRQVGPGVTKDQLYQLLGRPHFSEGFGAREWDYLFHFRSGEQVTTCQYKVIFDSEKHGRSFHWSPETCADVLKEAPGAAAGEQRFELSADALFEFDRADEADILPGGREQVADVAAKLKGVPFALVQVIGHTDELGTELYNQGLSQHRAMTVRKLLIDGGVPASSVIAIGAGESQPVKRCEDGLPFTELKACLQPNRRVEVIVSAEK